MKLCKYFISVTWWCFVFWTFFVCVLCDKASISVKSSHVYGPGLNANFTMPVRYFFIELKDIHAKSYASSPEKLSLQVAGLTEKCRIWYQLLHIGGGFFVARYRLYETCSGVRIDIIYEEESVAESPYNVDGTLFHEQCYCPKPMNDWLQALNCPASYSQIDEDLKIFPSVDIEKAMDVAKREFDNPGAFSYCHYAVVSNMIHRKCYGQYVGFSMFMDEILSSLARKMYLPDFELIANLGDWPLVTLRSTTEKIPIFSWCGSNDTVDIVMPTYDITEATLEMMGRVMVDMLSVMGNAESLWEKKIPMGFWRGRDSRPERLQLIKLARANPELINASLVNFFFYRDEEAEYGPKTEFISFFEFFNYRYQINIDGTVAAYRFPYLLAGKSLVLKQDSEYYEYFYKDLKPMVHYVPFNRNLSDLVDKLEWAKSHEPEAKEIADNAQQYALSNLMPKDVMCYYAVLFKEYSKRLKNKVLVKEGMEKVEQPAQTCNCPNQEEVKAKEEL